MSEVHIATTDPLGLGSIVGGPINVTDISGGPRSDFLEVAGGDGKFIQSALVALRPVEEWSIQYELLDTASFSIAFGAMVNTNYLVTSFSASCGPDSYPTVSVTVLKPSAAAKVKAYGSSITQTLTGGFGIVEKFGATATEAFVSSSCNITMQTLEAMGETDGDFMAAGLYHYGFKREVSIEAYSAITTPAANQVTDTDIRESRDGWKIFAANYWSYLDAS